MIISKVSSAAETINSEFAKKYPNLSEKVKENYSLWSDKFVSSYNKYGHPYVASLSDTKTNITSTVYALPASIGTTFQSYTSMFEPVDTNEREIARIPPSESLAEGEKVRPLDNERVELVNLILDIYGLNFSKGHFKFYDDDVIYCDPLIYTTGLSNLKAQFYGMQKLVKSSTKHYQIVENNLDIMKIRLQQKYTFPFVSYAVVRDILIVLEFNTNRKISKHTDLWSGKPIGKEGVLQKTTGTLFSTILPKPQEN